MKKTNFFAITLLAIFSLSAFTFYNVKSWKIDDNYEIKFESENPSGIFKDFKGDIWFDDANLSESKFDLTVDVSSISTGNGMKNNHAKSDKWFDAETYPTIKFVSTKVSKQKEGYAVTGNLTIKDITKSITIPVTFDGKAFNTKFTVNRLDYGVGNTKGMNKKASVDIAIDATVPVSKK